MSRGSAIIAILIASIASFTVGNLVGERSGRGNAEEGDIVVAADGHGEGDGEAPGVGAAGAGAAAPGGAPRYAIPVTSAQPSKGPANALVTVVVFSEFQCPFCSRMLPITEQMLREYPTQVRVVWRNLPLGFHPNAMPAAEAATLACARGLVHWHRGHRFCGTCATPTKFSMLPVLVSPYWSTLILYSLPDFTLIFSRAWVLYFVSSSILALYSPPSSSSLTTVTVSPTFVALVFLNSSRFTANSASIFLLLASKSLICSSAFKRL